jgi:hypothetical protein
MELSLSSCLTWLTSTCSNYIIYRRLIGLGTASPQAHGTETSSRQSCSATPTFGWYRHPSDALELSGIKPSSSSMQ